MAETLPQFFDEELQPIIDEGKVVLEGYLGKTIAPADIEYLLLNGFSYLRQLDYIKSNAAARQNLLSFANGVMLDYLGALLGVYRLPASAAGCTIRFTAVEGHPEFIIPAGVRVQTIDQKATYETLAQVTVAVDDDYKDVNVRCTDAGLVGNGYAEGQVTVILDPQAFLSTAANTDVPTGGASIETDEEMRERIQQAPNKFSVAGPDDAYKYFAKSANTAIVDVAIDSLTPGTVNIYPLLQGGVIPGSEVLEQVAAVCNGEKVRPLTDTVVVAAPENTDYTIEVGLTMLNTAVESVVLAQVNDNLLAFKTSGLNSLGRDVMVNKLIALCMVDGVYDADLTSPAEDIIAARNEFTNCTGITVTVDGYNEG